MKRQSADRHTLRLEVGLVAGIKGLVRWNKHRALDVALLCRVCESYQKMYIQLPSILELPIYL